MRKLTVLLIIFALLAGLAACGKSPVTNADDPTQSTTKPTEAQPSVPADPMVEEMQELLEYNGKYNYYYFALISEYESPADVYLYDLFAFGFKEENTRPTEQEREFLEPWMGDDFRDVRRLPVERMDAALTELFGITLDQTTLAGLERMRYFEDTDSYYGYSSSVTLPSIIVQKVEEQDDGTVKVYYRRDKGNDQDMIVTLKPVGDSYQIISNLYEDPRIAEFQALLEQQIESFYNDALTSVYDDPADVDLQMLFYDGFKDEPQSPTEQELELLEGKMGQYWKEMDLFRLPTEKMDAVLRELFGITLDESNGVGLDRLVYLEETNCYYMAHSGTHGADLIVSNVIEQENGSISVYYSYYLGDFLVSVKPTENGTYQILSNSILSRKYTEAAVENTVRNYFDQRRVFLQGSLSTIHGINPGILTDEASHLDAINASGVEWLGSEVTIQVNGCWDSHAEATATEVVTFRVDGEEQTETIVHRIQLGLSNTCDLIIVCDGYKEITTGFTSASYVQSE